MVPKLPQLEFVPVEKLLPHERHDDSRTRPLIIRIKNSGVFRNPPIVTPLGDGSGRYMVCDGANRTTALQQMGYPHALVQVVEPDDPGLGLQTWHHVVWELNPERFLRNLENVDGLRLESCADLQATPDLERDCGLAVVHDRHGSAFWACTPERALERRVELLNALVDTYRESARLDRTGLRDVETLANIYPAFCGLVVFPQFDIYDVLRLTGEGLLLPSGITRFTISPRALHLDYPLEALQSNEPLEKKNAELHAWLQERLDRKGVRYYAEATFLFDE